LGFVPQPNLQHFELIKGNSMKTVTLKIDNSIYEKFFWLLSHFSKNEVQILEQSDYISDDDYLRSINGMVESIKQARIEPEQQGVTLKNLDW
jgi:hypothetical protein